MSHIFNNERAYQRLANLISQQIIDGLYVAGQALPSERDLAKQLNVSRTSVREAVIALEVSGVLEVKTGSGVYVTSNAVFLLRQAKADLVWKPDDELTQFLNPQEEVSPFSLLQARLFIEPEIASLAAINMTDVHFDLIKEAYLMNVQDNLLKTGKHIGDRLMHIRIAIASGNDAYEMLMRQLLAHQYGKLFQTLQKHYTTHDMPLRSQAEHLSILLALEERNPKAARHAMKKHLQNVIDIFVNANS